MPINTKQLIELIIQPTLKELGLYSVSAEQLLAGTCAQESGMGTYLHQINGPALGIYQMEKATHDDILAHLPIPAGQKYHVDPASCAGFDHPGHWPDAEDMIYNLKYATSMCRVHYLRVKEALPAANDIPGLAAYWKKYYNTPNGAGTVEQFVINYEKYVLPYYKGK